MTAEQLAAVTVGDHVRLRAATGRVTQATKTWFMVSWTDGNVEVIGRRLSIMTERLQLEVIR